MPRVSSENFETSSRRDSNNNDGFKVDLFCIDSDSSGYLHGGTLLRDDARRFALMCMV